MNTYLPASPEGSHPGSSHQFPQGASDVVDRAQAELAAADIGRAAEIAVDVEADALHAFHSRLCFIQVGTDAGVYLFDTLAAGVEPSVLKSILENPERTKYFHAAGGDLAFLADSGIRVRGLFDTHRAVTLLGWPKVGLSDLARQLLNVDLPKQHQQSDFAHRPLPPAIREYIANDVRYLCEIGRIVQRACVERDILEEVRLDCDRLGDEAAARPAIGSDYKPRIAGGEMPPAQRALRLAVAMELHRLRLEWAERANVPFGRMLSNAAIAEIAGRLPTELNQLKKCPGVRGAFVREHGAEVLAALSAIRERAARGVLPGGDKEKTGGDSKQRRRLEKLKAFRAEKAAERGVTPSVVLTNALAGDLANKPPQTLDEVARLPYFGSKRFALYGPELLELLAKI